MKTILCLLAAIVLLCGCGKTEHLAPSAEPIYTNSYDSEIEIRMTAMAYGYYYAKAEAAGSLQNGIYDLTNSIPKDFLRAERAKHATQ